MRSTDCTCSSSADVDSSMHRVAAEWLKTWFSQESAPKDFIAKNSHYSERFELF